MYSRRSDVGFSQQNEFYNGLTMQRLVNQNHGLGCLVHGVELSVLGLNVPYPACYPHYLQAVAHHLVLLNCHSGRLGPTGKTAGIQCRQQYDLLLLGRACCMR